MKSLSYQAVGVDYSQLDPFKLMSQAAAAETGHNLLRFNFQEVPSSRGASVYLIETPTMYLAHVEEGLSSKNLIADKMYQLTGKSYYDQIAQDAVAMIVNDMITMGALPISVAMHLAVGTSEWFADQRRTTDLVKGWQRACELASCTWGGGETPTLKGIINPDTALLSGSAIGVISPKQYLIKPNIQVGDHIVLVGSSGIHANGLTLAREIASKLPNGYLTKLSDGTVFGEALLNPTLIYVNLIEQCLRNSIPLNYVVNITGHGWQKLMRANKPFTYVIDQIPNPQIVFKFIQEHGPLDYHDAYATFNMGTGFAIFVSPMFSDQVLKIASTLGDQGIIGGHVDSCHNDSEKRVIISPINVEYVGLNLSITE